MPAEGERDHRDGDQQRQVRRVHEEDRQHDECGERTEVEVVLAGQHQRRGLDPGRELEVRDDGAGEGDGTDEDADEHLGVVDAQQRAGELGLAGLVLDGVVAAPADQDGGQADEAVQQRDQLRHAGHLDDARAPQSDARTDDDGDDEQHDRDGLGVLGGHADRGCERDDHARDAVDDALLGGLVLGQACQREDEQQRRDDVGGLGDRMSVHCVSSFLVDARDVSVLIDSLARSFIC